MLSRHKGLATQQNKRAVQIRSELEVSAVCVFQENTTVADGLVKGIIRSGNFAALQLCSLESCH
jgi:hypothetical protein